MYGIGVHCYFPATIFTPGYEAEMLTKPKLTREIEGPEEGNPPDVLAARLLRGACSSIIHSRVRLIRYSVQVLRRASSSSRPTQ